MDSLALVVKSSAQLTGYFLRSFRERAAVVQREDVRMDVFLQVGWVAVDYDLWYTAKIVVVFIGIHFYNRGNFSLE